MSILPRPTRQRWQPLRGGLYNLYRYDNEEFHYEDGHLLLRGNNGTGKSRVLALQLPFLLDGEISPYRLEPDGDASKRMEWNLLMNKYPDRLGYTWIEFGRLDEEGNEHYCTLGCGLLAVKGRGVTDRWYFITSQRIGVDLFLEQEGGQPKRKDAFRKKLSGALYTTASDYRRGVNEALFGLEEIRYEALLQLLIQLRQPQLSRQLDEKRLSQALSDALPVINNSLLSDVAESFRGLDQEQKEYQQYEQIVSQVATFLKDYRHYISVIAKQRASTFRKSYLYFEQVSRQFREKEKELHEAKAKVSELETQIQEQERQAIVLNQEIETLKASPEMRNAIRLQDLSQQIKKTEQQIQNDKVYLQQLTRRLEDLKLRHEQCKAMLEQALSECERHFEQITSIAETIAAEDFINKHTSSWQQWNAEQLKTFDQAVSDDLQRRQSICKLLIQTERRIEQKEQNLEYARGRQQEQEAEVDHARDNESKAKQQVEQTANHFLDQVEQFLKELQYLNIETTSNFMDDLSIWSDTLHGSCPLQALVQNAVHHANLDWAKRLHLHQQHISEFKDNIAELEHEQRELEQGQDISPPIPYTRDDNLRQGRAGAPLWQCYDFATDLDDKRKAGFEAALEASGLLDAWITPEGLVIHPEEGYGDRFLEKLENNHVTNHSLDQILIPAQDGPAKNIGTERLQQLLQNIGSQRNEGQVWVDADGSWSLGPLKGVWQKDQASYVGYAARENMRLLRLEEIAKHLTELKQSLQELEIQLKQFDEEKRAIEREAKANPSSEALQKAHLEYQSSSKALEREQQRLSDLHAKVLALSHELDAIKKQLQEDAQDTGFSSWIGRFVELEQSLFNYGQSCKQFYSSLTQVQLLAKQSQQIELDLDQCQKDHGQAKEKLDQEEKSLLEQEVELKTLKASCGKAVDEVLKQIDESNKQWRILQDTLKQSQKNLLDENRILGNTEAACENKKIEQQEAESQRQSDLETFMVFVSLNLANTIDEKFKDFSSEETSLTCANDYAKRLQEHLNQLKVDEDRLDQSFDLVYKKTQELQTHFSSFGYQLNSETNHGVFIVSLIYQGKQRGMSELYHILQAEVESRQAILSSREREIIENHLVGEIAAHLHDLIHEGENLVKQMNQEISSRPMSTGMTLRFSWKLDKQGPEGLTEARKRLMRMGSAWSPDDRNLLGSFLQNQIQALRAEQSDLSWHQLLAQALDYRRWHIFHIERKQDSGDWQQMTKRIHGTGSGGEKAIALTLPQFAAAAAFYRSTPLAPRLVMLDEVFVGIDSDMRDKCMGLLQTFDLDFVMTSEREWGCYPSIKKLAIVQLATRSGFEAIATSRWVWNGNERKRDDRKAMPRCELEAKTKTI